MQAEDARRGSGQHHQVLVERDRELAALDDALERARVGSGGALLLEGGAGLGKSRLLAEAAALARTQGRAVLQARAQEWEGAFPFAVALQLFEGLLAGVDPTEAEALLAGAAGLARPLLTGQAIEHERPASSFSNVHGLYWLLVNLSRRSPVLLIIDDAHWSDEGSLRFLLYLAGRPDELPIALAVAARPATLNETGPLHALRCAFPDRHVRLQPLAPGGVASIVRASLSGADVAFCDACVEVTRGNPFDLRQLLLALAGERMSPTLQSVERLRSSGARSSARLRLPRLSSSLRRPSSSTSVTTTRSSRSTVVADSPPHFPRSCRA